jgi:hypothetical protein
VIRLAVLGLVACAAAPPAVAPAPIANVAPPGPPIAHAPPGYLEMHVDRVLGSTDGAAVILAVDGEDLALPIMIGGTEAASIDGRFAGRAPVRPLTHDLLDHIVERLGGTLIDVRVDALRDGIFLGTVELWAHGKLHHFDARPSDAIALAVGNHRPIYVARAVLAEAGVAKATLPSAGPAPPSI